MLWELRKKINSNWNGGLSEKITFQLGLEWPGAVAFQWVEVERVSGGEMGVREKNWS